MPTQTGSESPIVVTGLTNGVAYRARVRTLGLAGTVSAWTDWSANYTPSAALAGFGNAPFGASPFGG